MTGIEALRRKKYTGAKTVGNRFTAIVTKARKQISKYRPYTNRREKEYMTSTEKVVVDQTTAQAMREIVENWIEAKGGSCSVMSMAEVLVDREILTLHADAAPFNRSSRDKDPLAAKYAITKAFDTVKTDSSASVTMIQSWDEAKEKLATVITFPPESLVQAPESNSSLWSYFRKLTVSRLREKPIRRQSQEKLKEVGLYPASHTYHDPLQDEYKKREERLRSQAQLEYEVKLRKKEAEDEALKRVAEMMRPLSREERESIYEEWKSSGPPTENIRIIDTDSVQRESFQRLRPGQWLNDEVIHYFLLMLAKRDEELVASGKRDARTHFFKSFFMTKLLNIGSHTSPNQYEYANVKRWSKKVPGKDIFKLDKIIFPINQGGMHWVCAVAFMKEKKIQFYDSMGDDGMEYLRHILHYLQDEHQAKKDSPLPDDWELIPCQRDVPRQRNGFDCGVFTCMFADFISKDCPLVFSQAHVTQCRERIALSILKGQALE